ncbi:RTC4-like domain-containing protein [Daedaleopsis nitida]|nr:RTC4-like domain-containing protein [Daedaleopsis nitida]
MEAYGQNLRSKDRTLDTDPSPATRLTKRPILSARKENMFEDFGSDFASRQNRATRNLPKACDASRKGSRVAFSDYDDSDDEIDFLSSSSRHSSESPTKPKSSKSATIAEPVPVVIDRHQADPNYRALDFKKMKIPKKTSASSSTALASGASNERRTKVHGAGPSTSQPVTQPRSHRPATSPVQHEQAFPKKKLPLRERSPNQDRSRIGRQSNTPQEREDLRKERMRDMDKTPRPSRPVPRPVNKGRGSLGKSQTVPDLGSHSSQENDHSRSLSRSRSTQDIIHILGSSESDSPGTNAPKKGANGKAKATSDPFDMISPLSSQTDKGYTEQNVGNAKGKGKERADPIGALSPLSSPGRFAHRSAASSFPMPSPLSSPASRQSDFTPRVKGRVSSSQKYDTVAGSSEEEDEGPRRILRPFPMETQVLASIRNPSPADSPDRPADRSGTYRKNVRTNTSTFDFDDDFDDDDDMRLDPSIDPKTLCPWCDEPLPSEPTPHLLTLIAATKRVSQPAVRLANPLALHAPITNYVAVCQRHRFERNWIPRARDKGWPTKIRWEKLAKRITRLKDVLQAIVDDVDEDFAPALSRESGSSRRARKENEFWQEAVINVRQHGSRQTAGARGQFMHFNKTQPGYYGELGYVIIHQTLCDLFPPTDFHPDATLPLTPSDFIALILVPEAAVHLIIEDLSLSRSKAIETLRDSVEYGVAMFPADEGEGDIGNAVQSEGERVGATEQIFMERARARRKELEEEEEEERREEEQAQARRASETKSKPRPRPRGKTPGTTTDVESVEPTSPPPSSGPGAKRKARGRPTARNAGPPPGSIVIELSSDTAESDIACPSKRRRKARSAKSDIEMDDAGPSAANEATPKAPKVKPRPRPKARSGSVTSGRGDDSDIQEVGAVLGCAPSSSQAMPCVAFSQNGDSAWQGTSGTGSQALVDGTPRAKTKPRRSDTLSIIPSPFKASGSGLGLGKAPLQIAKERRLSHIVAPSVGHRLRLERPRRRRQSRCRARRLAGSRICGLATK